ncbi:MAG: Holliday junction branch migration protein RuvA [Victivallaceae bacterium]
MIGRLRGELIEKEFTECLLDVQGVGYVVFIPLSTYDKLPECGQESTLYISTQVREDAINLFGFTTPGERRIFETLLNVNGVGGKLALNILSSMPVANFCRAVVESDFKLLSKINGVGKKIAERLVVELRDKLAKAALENLGSSGDTAISGGGRMADNPSFRDAAAALEMLGFKRDAVACALEELASDDKMTDANCEDIIRKTLQKLNS